MFHIYYHANLINFRSADDLWQKISDSAVSKKFNFEDFQNSEMNTPYILYYERLDTSPDEPASSGMAKVGDNEKEEELIEEDDCNNISINVSAALTSTAPQRVLKQWLSLLQSGIHSDFTIKSCDGCKIKCHSLVFQVQCPVVVKHAVQEGDGSFNLILRYSYASIMTVLQYVYGGVEVSNPDADVQDLMQDWGLGHHTKANSASPVRASEKRKLNADLTETKKQKTCDRGEASTIPQTFQSKEAPNAIDDVKSTFGEVFHCNYELSVNDKITEFPWFTPDIVHTIETAKQSRENEILIEAHNETITGLVIKSLAGTNWLVSDVINFYLKMMVSRSETNLQMKSMYAYSTFFFNRLESAGYGTVCRWTKNVDIFSKKLVLVPIHRRVHWSLIVIDMEKKHIIYLDSNKEDDEGALLIIAKYLLNEHWKKKERHLEKGWKLINAKKLPKQENDHDCGVFLCQFAEYTSRCALFTFDQSNMQYFRDKMIYEILKNDFMNI